MLSRRTHKMTTSTMIDKKIALRKTEKKTFASKMQTPHTCFHTIIFYLFRKLNRIYSRVNRCAKETRLSKW